MHKVIVTALLLCCCSFTVQACPLDDQGCRPVRSLSDLEAHVGRLSHPMMMAYLELNKTPFVNDKGELLFSGPDYSQAQSYLRLHALESSKDANEALVATLVPLDINAPLLPTMFAEAAAWAQEEKRKSGWDLYSLARHDPLETIKPAYLIPRFQDAYYALATKRGSLRVRLDAWKEEALFYYELIRTVIDPTRLQKRLDSE